MPRVSSAPDPFDIPYTGYRPSEAGWWLRLVLDADIAARRAAGTLPPRPVVTLAPRKERP